jgi:serine/threonine protein kinase
MATLSCEHICKVYKGCIVGEKEVWLILEFVNGGNLHQFLTGVVPLSLERQLSFAIQATKAVQYIHNKTPPILHRDINSFNFLIKDNTTLLLTDFRSAKPNDFVTSQTATFGTLRWTAPEVLVDHPKWSEKADIYSLGMVFFEIVSGGEIPFKQDISITTLIKNIVSGLRPKIPDSCSIVNLLSFILFYLLKVL